MLSMDHLTPEWMMMRYEQTLAEARADRAADRKMARRIKALCSRIGRGVMRLIDRRPSERAIATAATRRNVVTKTPATLSAADR